MLLAGMERGVHAGIGDDVSPRRNRRMKSRAAEFSSLILRPLKCVMDKIDVKVALLHNVEVRISVFAEIAAKWSRVVGDSLQHC